MSIVATALRELIAAGLSGEALIAAVERIEAAQAVSCQPIRTARQERNARYYENRKARVEASKASESVLIQTSETVSDDELKKERVPEPLKETTPPASEPNGSSVRKAPSKFEQGEFLPDDWRPSAEDWNHAIAELRSETKACRERDKFLDFWGSKGGKEGKKRNWSKTWRNWVRRAADNGTGPQNPTLFTRPAGGGRQRPVISVVGSAMARHADHPSVGPWEGSDAPRSGDEGGRRSSRDDTSYDDADWTPASRYSAAH